ncbi:11S globulin seed storage protein Ana o 2.0101-like [Salvia miltiorrhiza]|uniref:11S globulin seed storage protein Ana o 2.0101-like n=1 Tax=Salvia miltiorrhiza TaxID=226208 RepID=UPI0025AB9AE1|nr:11S globulin seed storage protein Ana o 2.0101-like [Salvia miltiorrhiza]
MAPTLSLSLITAFLLFTTSSALVPGGEQQQEDSLWQNLRHQQQHRLRARTDCRVDRLTAQEPTLRFDSEAGRTEFWDRNNQQFECAGVAAVRNYIKPRGLLLPHYNNAPQLLYVVRGRGLLGVVIPGCAETFETEMRQRDHDRSRSFVDRHQKVRQFRQGDVIALPAGFTLWFYNNGDERLETVALLDTGNQINQLDHTFRNFFLAGKPRGEAQGSESYRSRRRGESEQSERDNIFNPFDDELLAEIFNVDIETARKLKSQDDFRGQIVQADRFDILFPGGEEEERESRRRGRWWDDLEASNGLEETLCSARLRLNLDEPARADVYNPRGGRISAANSQKLPILSWLRLSAEKGVLYRNAIMAPTWNANAHSVIYITRGSGRFQVVGQAGKAVFDGEVREGQMIIVPQNFAMIKKANNEEGLEWISFKTNDNAVVTPLAGRLSALRAMPEEVLMSAYDISREDARNLKFKREESRIMSSTSRRSSRYPSRPWPIEYALDVIKSMM